MSIINKLLISSSVYSLTPILDKYILQNINTQLFILLKYIVRVGLIILTSKIGLFEPKVFTGLKKSGFYLVLLAGVSLFSQNLYYDVLKDSQVSIIEPLGNIFITIFTVIGGVLFFKEQLNRSKIIGLVLSCVSIYLLQAK